MNEKKIVRIWGGLGNQLFQYFGKFLEKNFKQQVIFNIEWFNKNNKRKYILDHLLKFENKTSSEKINFVENLKNYRTEKLYKYLCKKILIFYLEQ